MQDYADYVKESTTTVGTGTLNLGGAAAGGFRTFVSAFGDGGWAVFVIENGTDREVVKGRITAGAPDTLTRDFVYSSTNAGALVNWAAGTKNVFCDATASRVCDSGRAAAIAASVPAL